MPNGLAIRRARLVATLTPLPGHMRVRLDALKREGEELRQRPDLLWYLLLQSAATQGNSRGWAGLCGDPVVLASVAFSVLGPLVPSEREERLLAALRKGKVRMPTVKAPRLAANVARITGMGGVEQATRRMLALPDRGTKYSFMLAFEGIGPKYARNVWMDVYDSSFRDTVAVDERLNKLARALGLTETRYPEVEGFYCALARDAGLEPWELDRLLYNFTDHFLQVIASAEA